MDSKPILTYFNGRGRAEITRIIFYIAGIEYEDKRVQDHTPLIAEGKLPFGQLPILEIHGTTIAQSFAIQRYAAKLAHMYGKDELEAAKIDMIMDGIADVSAARNAAKTEEQKEDLKNKTVPKFLNAFEKIAAANGAHPHFVGDKITVADVAFFTSCDYIGDVYLAFPHLAKIHEAVKTHPKVAEWLVKRPQTPV